MTGLIKVLKGVNLFEGDERLLIQINKEFQVFAKVNNEINEEGIYWEIQILSEYAKRNPLMFLRHLKTFNNQIKKVYFLNSYYDFDFLESIQEKRKLI